MTLGKQNVENTEDCNAPAQPPRFPRLGHSGLGSRGSGHLAGISAAQTKGQTSMQTAMSEQRYKPPVHFGLGGVPLGNEFAVITEKDAYAALEAAWSAGVRYYDTSPWYSLGLCERRFGNFLHTKKRSDYVLSSKVGKLLKASRQNNAKEYFPFTPSPNNLVYDYTADGVKRSIEDSLQRLGVDALDIVFVHDLSPDNPYLPSRWEEQFEIARKGAFPALTRMREDGIIKGWGLGVNRPEPIMKLLDVADPDASEVAAARCTRHQKNLKRKHSADTIKLNF